MGLTLRWMSLVRKDGWPAVANQVPGVSPATHLPLRPLSSVFRAGSAPRGLPEHTSALRSRALPRLPVRVWMDVGAAASFTGAPCCGEGPQ